MSERDRLDEARAELVRLGYLSHRFERFLLQDALVSGSAGRGLAILAGRVGLAGGALVAAVNTLALALANRILDSALRELPLLFLHVFVPVAICTALGFLLVAVAFRGFLAAFPRRGIELARIGSALGAATAMVGVGVWLGWEFLVGLPRLERTALGAFLPLVAGGVAKLVADGLLAFEIRWVRHVPHARLISRRSVALAIGASVAMVALGALVLSPKTGRPAPIGLQVSQGARVLLIGIDGVLADELEFLIGRGELPTVARLAREGGVLAAYERVPNESPAAFWSTVATGRNSPDHGVEALDGFRLLGMSVPLARTGPWKIYFASIAAPAGLAEQRALLSGRRRAPTLWELVAGAGRAVVSIDWWATYPAQELPGAVIAHGAWSLLADGDPLAVAPAALAREIAALRTAQLAVEPELAGGATELVDRSTQQAVAHDAFYRAVARRLASGAQALALYLPAADLVASTGKLTAGALSIVIRRELIANDSLLAELLPEFDSVALVVDAGRRGGGEGRVLFWNGECQADSRPHIAPAVIASTLLRAAGFPQSRELPAPVDFCGLPPAATAVATFGERALAARPVADDHEYIETLRSLGYL